MSSATYGQLSVIMSLIAITICSFAGLTAAGSTTDIKSIMRDISTEVNSFSATTTSSSSPGVTPSATTIRQLMLQNSSTKKATSDEQNLSIDDNNDDADDDGLMYNEPSSAELLRFVNDNENANDNDEMENSDFNDLNVYNNKNKNNRQHMEVVSERLDSEISDNNNNNNKNNYHSNAHSGISNNNNNDYIESLSVRDQVRLLAKQLNVLMNRRREDYELLERNLRKSLRMQHSHLPQEKQSASNDLDLRNEMENLRLVFALIQHFSLICFTNIRISSLRKEI